MRDMSRGCFPGKEGVQNVPSENSQAVPEYSWALTVFDYFLEFGRSRKRYNINVITKISLTHNRSVPGSNPGGPPILEIESFLCKKAVYQNGHDHRLNQEGKP